MSSRSCATSTSARPSSIEAAEKLGRYDWLYLITELEDYYEKTGWEFVDHVPVGHGHTEKVYRYPLKR